MINCAAYAFDKYMEEVTDANSYLEKAMEIKETNPKMASALHVIAMDEIKHAKAMRDMVANELKSEQNIEQRIIILDEIMRHGMKAASDELTKAEMRANAFKG